MITYIDSLLIMTVNPGFGGQSFIETMLPKIAQARQMADDAGVDLDIAVDGGIDLNTAPLVVQAGANLLVAGTSLFNNDLPPGRSMPGTAGGRGIPRLQFQIPNPGS